MNFYFEPRTQAYKNWEQVKIGDRVVYKGVLDEPATVRNAMETMVAIEFDKPVSRVLCTTHDCFGEVPSGNGYYVFILSLIEKIIE